MAEISQAMVTELETIKNRIGWSWNEIAARTGWGPHGMVRFKTLKMGIEDRWLEYFRAVAEAVESVPLPAAEEPTVEAAPSPVDEKLLAQGFHPPSNETTEVRVMLLDDIARKIADQYLAIQRDPEMNADERRGGLAAVASLAEAMGVLDLVRTMIRPAQTASETPRQPVARAIPRFDPPRFQEAGREPF